MMNNLACNLTHDVNSLTEICRTKHRRVEGIRCVQGPVVSTSRRWKTYLKQIYALLICISNSNSNEKACVLTPRHAARINTQFILSKWITYLICAGAVIIISLAHKHYTHSLPVNKAYEIPFCQLALWEMIRKKKKKLWWTWREKLKSESSFLCLTNPLFFCFLRKEGNYTLRAEDATGRALC